MPRLMFKVLLDAPLEAVWAFHEDVHHALALVMPPDLKIRITRADAPGPGAQIVARMSVPPLSWVGRQTRWVSRYSEYEPPKGEPPRRRAHFTDEQAEGPLSRWRHEHRFEETLDEGRTKVWVIDELDYALPLGPLGWIADRLIGRRRIARIFMHRQKVMRQRLSRRPEPSA